MGALLNQVAGILLAGGAARRMDGVDKPLITLSGKTLLAYGIDLLRPQCQSLLLSINGDGARFSEFDVPVVPDDIDGQVGPLAGILACLDWLARQQPNITDAVTLPADTPFAPHDLVVRLKTAREEQRARIAVAGSGERRHHAVALWPVALRGVMRSAVIDGELSVGRFARRFDVADVNWPIVPFDPFFNINTPADAIAAEHTVRLYGCGT